MAGAPALATVLVSADLRQPVDLQAPPGDRHRVFVLERRGRIRILRDGSLLSTPFLDISSRVGVTGQGEGLLGLAFHPRYSENGRFFIRYSDRDDFGHLAELRVSSNPDLADPESERDLIVEDHPHLLHHGGGLVFGADGMLYASTGDADKPNEFAQELGSTLAKILRIDVDGGSPYLIPPDNPFVGRAGARGEVWAYGLRNPWRFTFDRATGDMLIGDVGRSKREEIDLGLAANRGGENYGWNIFEGSQCIAPSSGCSTRGFTFPVLEYRHNPACAVIGGPVYRGCRMPGYHGTFFYGDFCSGEVHSLRIENGQAVDRRDWTSSLGRGLDLISSFGVDGDGEVYILDLDGEVYKVVPAS